MPQDFAPIATQLAKLLKRVIQIELTQQGHNLTGTLLTSIDYRIVFIEDGFDIYMESEKYGIFVNSGVQASRIPYTQGSGRKTSKYIQGLMAFAKARFHVSDKEANSIAFAIARKHKKEGMPTNSSYQFSKTGKRTGFVTDAINKVLPEIDKIINTFSAIMIRRIIEAA